jgi:AraC family transcriptional regulator
LAGEAVAEYVKKRRLDAAADLLAHTDRRIIDIAVECGFGSQEAFSRAFGRA